MSEEFVPKTYTLRQSDLEVIEARKKELDTSSDSYTLRQILAEYRTMKLAQLPLPMDGTK